MVGGSLGSAEGGRTGTSSTDAEWEEIKKGNLGVALIFVAMIFSVGLVLYKVI